MSESSTHNELKALHPIRHQGQVHQFELADKKGEAKAKVNRWIYRIECSTSEELQIRRRDLIEDMFARGFRKHVIIHQDIGIRACTVRIEFLNQFNNP